MANSIDTNRELQATYRPNHAAVVRLADEAKLRGRAAHRGNRKFERKKYPESKMTPRRQSKIKYRAIK